MNDLQEEERQKASHRSRAEEDSNSTMEKVFLFATVQETLEFCESALIRRIQMPGGARSLSVRELVGPSDQPLDALLTLVMGASAQEAVVL